MIADSLLQNGSTTDYGLMVVAIVMGISLSACCGFRVFTPLFIFSASGYFELLPITIAPEYNWAISLYAMIFLGIATITEMLAYYVPWLDNALDVIATPSAVIAGSCTGLIVMSDLPPFMQWGIALIAGGGSSGIIQFSTAAIRATSTATTAGCANSIITFFENLASIILPIIAIVAPFIAIVLIILCAIVFYKMGNRIKAKLKRINTSTS